ncbi:hypothetical protein Ancab_017702 [Ancistrocladus abbreviatus]
MSNSWLHALSSWKGKNCTIFNRTIALASNLNYSNSYKFYSVRQFCNEKAIKFNSTRPSPFNHFIIGSSLDFWALKKVAAVRGIYGPFSTLSLSFLRFHCANSAGFCVVAGSNTHHGEDIALEHLPGCNDLDLPDGDHIGRAKPVRVDSKSVDFTHFDKKLLPTIIIVGRPNVGKSALFNRLIRRREALVYNTPDDHVTRDIREGIAKLGDLRFQVLDSAGLEAAASSGSILERTAEMTANVLSRSQCAIFLIDARDGLQPMDLQVGKWLRRHIPGMKTILVMNKSELLEDTDGSLAAATGEAYRLGFGDPIPISAETGLGMADLYDALRPLLEEHMAKVLDDGAAQSSSSEFEDSQLRLQLAIVGRPNVGKSTLLNTLLQEDRVLVGPEAGLTRDSIRAQFQYEGRTIYMVDTAGWLDRTKQKKGPASLSIMQTRKNLMRAHVIALVLDAEEIAKARKSMKHAEVVIARQAVEEGRGLVVIVNKMDLLKGRQNSKLYEDVTRVVPEEIQTLIPQVSGIPVVFVSALEGRGRKAIMQKVIETYEKWCLRLSTARLNRWLHKVMSRHSWKDQAAQPKIKYFTQVKARPPTFVAFIKGKTELSDTDIRFLTKSLKEDFNMGGIPIRVLQRSFARKDVSSSSRSSSSSRKISHALKMERAPSDKRYVAA